MLRVILKEKNISLYGLEKKSDISHSTLSDIYNEKINIESKKMMYEKCINPYDIHNDKFLIELSPNKKNRRLKTIRNIEKIDISKIFFFILFRQCRRCRWNYRITRVKQIS